MNFIQLPYIFLALGSCIGAAAYIVSLFVSAPVPNALQSCNAVAAATSVQGIALAEKNPSVATQLRGTATLNGNVNATPAPAGMAAVAMTYRTERQTNSIGVDVQTTPDPGGAQGITCPAQIPTKGTGPAPGSTLQGHA